MSGEKQIKMQSAVQLLLCVQVVLLQICLQEEFNYFSESQLESLTFWLARF